MRKVTNKDFRYLMKVMAKYVKEFEFYFSCILALAGMGLIGYGFHETLNGNLKNFAFIVGGFTFLNALLQLTKSIREEQFKYDYQMVKDWHDLIAYLNNESKLFELNIQQYKEKNVLEKKTVGDDFQRLIDHMNLILWAIHFDINVDVNSLREAWSMTFRKLFPDITMANYLWNDKGYKYTISEDIRDGLDRIFSTV